MNIPTTIFSRQHLLSDLLAGTVTFLVAVPLCLGIAMASGAEPVTGLITGIVAGLLVGSISGTQVMISGPAAGLTTVVAMEIAALGSFESLLLAVIIAGVIQILMGLMRGGFIKSFVPTSVVRGLLSAIGIILILKQIPHLFGHDTDYEGEMSFFQPDKENTFSEIIRIAGDLHVGAMTVGIISLGLIYIWLRWKPLRSSGIPAPLAVVLFGFLADYLFSLFGSPWAIGATHRVQVPIIESFSQVSTILKLPDFQQIGNPEIYSAGL
ncbi:MAG: SulP family inorganic anion transporter, partial [Pirellulales bacterium]